MLKRVLVICLVCITTVACTTPQNQNIDTANVNNLENLNVGNAPRTPSDSIGNIRVEALKETATSLGARGALAWESQVVNKTLKENTYQLDQIFNFQALLLNHHVLPPVLEQSNQLFNLANVDTVHIADKTYKILKQARFVTTAPNWRQYLMMNFKKPELPDKTLLPKNNAERWVWIKYIQKGWQQGLTQGKAIYQANLARLKRDYNGMVLYRQLYSRHMISKPTVASTPLGVTSNNADSQIYINDKVMRITSLPRLNPNSHDWRAVLTQ